MKAKKSPLELIDIAVINSQLNFLSFNENADIKEEIENYNIDIDFVIAPEGELFKIFIKAHINQEEPLKNGYSIFAECAAVFKFSETLKITLDEQKKYLINDGVPIALNSLRIYIINLTASSPIGRYVLPTINLQDLLMQKHNLTEQIKANVKKRKSNQAKK